MTQTTLAQKALSWLVRTVGLQDARLVQATGHGVSHAGETVTTQSMLALSAAWACVNLLSGTISSLPLMVYALDRAGQRRVATEHSLYGVLHDRPNADQTAVDFWDFLCACIEVQGDGFAEKLRGVGGRVIGLGVPIAPDLMQVRRTSDGDLEYRWSEYGRARIARSADMLHVRGFGGSPLGGLSTLSFGRQTFGLAMAIEKSAGSTFRNGIRASGFLSVPEGKVLDAQQRNDVEELLHLKYQGTINAGLPMVLDNGLKWNALSINPEDAQMLQSRGFSVEEICRFFGVPPFMIGHTEKTTSWGSGVEQAVLGFQKFTLRRRLKRLEQALEQQLLSAAERAAGMRIEFNLEGLLRGDSAARATFYKEMTMIGAMTINEVRALENLPPVTGGDVPRMQMQQQPITAAAPLTN